MLHNALLSRCLPLVMILLSIPAQALSETVLRYTDHEPYGGMRTLLIKTVFFAAIEKESQGRLKIDAHWNGELATSYAALKTLGEGKKADIGIVVPEYTPEALPLHQIFKSFPVGPGLGGKQVEFFRRVFSELPAFSEELKKNNLVNLQFFLGYPAGFFSAKPLQTLADLKGETWRTASFWHKGFLKNAGATPVTMPWTPAIAEALGNSKLSGLIVNLDSGYDLKAHHVAPHLLFSPSLWLGHVYLLVMNQETWNGLEKQDQQAIQRAAASTLTNMGTVLDSSVVSLVKKMEDEGVTVRYLSHEEQMAWQADSHYSEVQTTWAAEQKKQGVKGAAETIRAVTPILDSVMR
ncbi:TRAP transporter substrate-binding protein DctP [Yokenella regensburgei]|uniref:TRAP transporter substrate-binding protein DctP n=1 Tax=Yokenella regensburgei TaxID=158877 RepID=UPI003F17EFA9